MKIEVDLLPPLMPNFALKADYLEKEDESDSFYDISVFTRQEAEQYADLMREAFMKHWEQRKAQKKALKELTNESE
jgi:hypothetical protein